MAAKGAKERSPLEKLYADLTKAPLLDPGMQHRIYTYAQRSGRLSLLTRLAHTPDIDPTIDDLLREHRSRAVRAGWASRPGRPAHQLLELLEQTTGTGPLAKVVAAAPAMPPEVYAAAATSKTLIVHEELLRNPDAPRTVKLLSARRVAASLTDVHSTSANIEKRFGDDPDLLVQALGDTESVEAHVWAATHRDLDPGHLTRMLTLAERLGGDWYTDRLTLRAASAALRQPHCSGRDRAAWSTIGTRVASRLHPADQDVLDYRAAFQVGGHTAPPARPMPDVAPVHAAASARTSDELRAAAATAVTTGRQDVVLALLKNRHITSDTMDQIAEPLRRLKWATLESLSRQRTDNLDVLALLYLYSVHYIPSDEHLARTGRPVQALRTCIEHYVRRGLPVPPKVGKSAYVTRDIVAAMPLSTISRHGSLAAKVLAAELVDEALTRDGVWELFEAMSDSFPGSLSDLLEACGFIVAPSAA